VQFYNNERRHSSLQYLTPAQYYRGNPDEFLKTRKIKMEMARMIRKERNMKERKGGEVAGASHNYFSILSRNEKNSTFSASHSPSSVS
jgi:hypothetical protein